MADNNTEAQQVEKNEQLTDEEKKKKKEEKMRAKEQRRVEVKQREKEKKKLKKEAEKKENVGQDKKVKKEEEKGAKPNKEGIEFKKETNFADWYTQVITKSEMIEYHDVSGCYILRPWSFQIWDMIREFVDMEIKKLGVQNAYFPMFVKKKWLELETEHLEGFSPEVCLFLLHLPLLTTRNTGCMGYTCWRHSNV